MKTKTKLTEDNYVDIAEKVIQNLNDRKKRDKKFQMVTTSKIRNILAMTADLYTDVMAENSNKLSNDLIGRVNYLKLRIVYASGRDKAVYDFVDEAGLLDYVETAKSSRAEYKLFSRYMEALVAYHKYNGGKD